MGLFFLEVLLVNTIFSSCNHDSASRLLRLGENNSPMEVDSDESVRHIPDSSWTFSTISIDSEHALNASMVTIKLDDTEAPTAPSMSEYDTNGSMECDIMRTCAFCKKRLNYTGYAIVCDLSRDVFWHTDCYLLWNREDPYKRILVTPTNSFEGLNDNISDTPNHTISNIPYGDTNESTIHQVWDQYQCKITAFVIFTIITVPVAIAVLVRILAPSYFERSNM